MMFSGNGNKKSPPVERLRKLFKAELLSRSVTGDWEGFIEA